MNGEISKNIAFRSRIWRAFFCNYVIYAVATTSATISSMIISAMSTTETASASAVDKTALHVI